MSIQPIIERIESSVFIIDGAMGTELFNRGVQATGSNNNLNLESPGDVLAVHESYVQAGCDGIITNTFEANSISLARHGLADKVEAINAEGARIARKAAGEDGYVLGGLGPCGDFLEPLGAVKADELNLAFQQQAKVLADGGVDAFIIETMTALDELVVAVEAVKAVSDLPVIASMSFDAAGDEFRSMMGVSPADAVAKLAAFDIYAMGFNCGTLDMEGYVGLAGAYADAIADTGMVLLAEANAGKPELVDGRAVYSLSAADFAEAGLKIHAAGAKILGGCCGTTPGHIKALADGLRG